MHTTETIIKRKPRLFLPDTFELNTWQDLEPYIKDLDNRALNSVVELEKWLGDKSEIEAYLEENLARRYTAMTCDTENHEKRDSYLYYVQNIDPQLAPYSDKLNKKLAACAYKTEVRDPSLHMILRSVENDIKLFREENIALNAEMQSLQQNYGATVGAMAVNIDGQEFTLQQAAVKLQETDRALREKVWFAIQDRRLQDKQTLDDLLDQLIKIRHQVAQNAGFENYRDYMFSAMGRFDFTKEDCFDFHDAVSQGVVPILSQLAEKRKEHLKVDALKPWDFAVDEFGRKPLKPFNNGAELLEKTIACFELIEPEFAGYLKTMNAMGHLDLESRKGKAPGGYNYPYDEVGVPFIFMNATSTLRDMVTLLHEGGHAIHSFITRDLSLNFYKHTPSEVAELASMSMELISMKYWHTFFDNEEDLKRAKLEHLTQVIETLPWVALIDAYQNRMYECPQHSQAERTEMWLNLHNEFSDNITDWSGLEKYKANIWQKQLHIYEVPFYYIEYGMAQLGAIALWKRYMEDKAAGLAGYKAALKLGYTKSVKDIYAAAGIEFNFSAEYIKSLTDFVKAEIAKL